MPKGSPELTEKRKNEILDACEKIYVEHGFFDINIKQISTEISLTRPAIYNYFETKEEILLGLLSREYILWCEELEDLIPLADKCDHSELAEKLAKTLEYKRVLLRILNMNLFEIELNSRVERLAEFKRLYLRAITALSNILHAYKSDISDSECDDFSSCFCAIIIGLYPLCFHGEKQQKAMEMAGLELKEVTIYQIVRKSLLKLLP